MAEARKAIALLGWCTKVFHCFLFDLYISQKKIIKKITSGNTLQIMVLAADTLYVKTMQLIMAC